MTTDTQVRCSFCGGSALVVTEEADVAIGRRSAVVEQEFIRCSDCEREYETPSQMDQTEARAVAAIREQEGLLQPEEIKEIRRRYHLTQEGLEQLLGIGKKTVVRWESGTIFQSRAADTLLRVVGAVPRAALFLTRLNRLDVLHPHLRFIVPGLRLKELDRVDPKAPAIRTSEWASGRVKVTLTGKPRDPEEGSAGITGWAVPTEPERTTRHMKLPAVS